MLNAVGESRDTVSMIPIIFWRTPGGRTPSQNELDMARPFVDKAIELIKPRVILTLGTLPATQIANVNLTKSHGIAIELENGATCVPIFHPNYLILKPAAKRDVWNALQNVQNILKTAE
jgi:DNA polymerase